MLRFKHFIRQSFVGGVLVIAPTVILLLMLRWAFGVVRGLIAPLAAPLAKATGAPPLAIDALVLMLVFFTCFLVGTIVATRTGRWMQNLVDHRLSKLMGYKMIRDILTQLLGARSDSPFKSGEVAFVQPFGPASPTLTTAIITSRHRNGWYTVFMPTGPNPTSGFIYHLPPDCVTPRPDISLETAFKSVISCGAGSADLITFP